MCVVETLPIFQHSEEKKISLVFPNLGNKMAQFCFGYWNMRIGSLTRKLITAHRASQMWGVKELQCLLYMYENRYAK